MEGADVARQQQPFVFHRKLVAGARLWFQGKDTMTPSVTSYLAAVATVLGMVVAGAATVVYSGAYNMGADDPHSAPMFATLQTLRDRSIAMHARDLHVPDLSDPQQVMKEPGQYAARCTQCHLSPALQHSEIRPGLYPQPPNLAMVPVDPKAAFWVIKHGIKMSAMPAWGASHDDATIWSMVAFLQKLPGMSAFQYTEMVARAHAGDEMDVDAPADPAHGTGVTVSSGTRAIRGTDLHKLAPDNPTD